jgi:hypothetical protein
MEDTSMRIVSRVACTALASALVAGNAAAGLLDSPPPQLGSGASGIVVYRMGPIHYEPGGWVDTTVTCNNLADSAARIAFEIFDDNDRVAGQVTNATVEAGGAVTFATSSDAEAPGAMVVNSLPPIDHGKARVSASTNQLSCTGTNRMRASDGSVKEAALELVKKVAY